jgi:hypothetical protein
MTNGRAERVRNLIVGLIAVGGWVMMGSGRLTADSCQEVYPDCEQCVPDDLGSCCHSFPPCYCVYDLCAISPSATLASVQSRPAARAGADEQFLASLRLPAVPRPEISSTWPTDAIAAACVDPRSPARKTSRRGVSSDTKL